MIALDIILAHPQNTWSREHLDLLVERWATGDGAQVIARLLGRTKNSVLGKAHRLGLEKRSNPAKPWADWQKDMLRQEWDKGTPPPKIAQKIGKSTAAIYGMAKKFGLPRRWDLIAAAKPRMPQSSKSDSRLILYREQQKALVRTGQLLKGVFGQRKYAAGQIRFKKCQWIEGDPSADDRCKCGKRTKDGNPYCSKHQSIAYHAPKWTMSAEQRAAISRAQKRRYAKGREAA